MEEVPEIVLLDAADSPKVSNLSSRADDLDSHMRTDLDRGILVMKAGRRAIGIPLNLTRNQLRSDVSAINDGING